MVGDSIIILMKGMTLYLLIRLHSKLWLNGIHRIFSQPFLLDALCDKVRDACSLGSNITYLVWEWLKLLQWPDDPENYTVDATTNLGISYFELLINFQVCTNYVLPVPINPGDRYTAYVHYFRMKGIFYRNPFGRSITKFVPLKS